MKKNILFSALILLSTVALFLLRITKMPVHIAVSVIGLALLVVFTLLTRKNWKLPALEIVSRIFYLVALVTGIVIMNVHGIAALSIVHKLSAALFAVLFVFLFVHKLVAKKK